MTTIVFDPKMWAEMDEDERYELLNPLPEEPPC